MFSSHYRCRWRTRSPCLSISGRLAHGFDRPLIRTLRRTHIQMSTHVQWEPTLHYFWQRNSVPSQMGQQESGGVCWSAGGQLRGGQPRWIHVHVKSYANSYIITHTSDQHTLLYKTIVCVFEYLALTGKTGIICGQHFITDQCSCAITEGLWNTNHMNKTIIL